MRLQKVKSSYHIYIPREIVENVLKWHKGDKIDYNVVAEDNKSVLVLQKGR